LTPLGIWDAVIPRRRRVSSALVGGPSGTTGLILRTTVHGMLS
jgi:hypothetical protein